MSEQESYIYPVDLLECDGKPFGHLIAAAAGDIPISTGPLPSNVLLEVKKVRDAVKQLVLSDEEIDVNAVNNINAIFTRNDMYAVNETLEMLDTHTLPRRDVLGWINKSSSTDIARFALWNVRRHQALQESLLRDQAKFDDDTMARTDKLIDINLFPKHARSHVERAIGKYGTFIAMDTFEQGATGASGLTSESKMSLANIYASANEMSVIFPDMAGTVFHERMHGAGFLNKTGFMNGIFSEVPLRWLEESSVAHATAVAISPRKPQPETISPSDRAQLNDGVYEYERELLSVLLSKDAANIPVDLLYEAFFTGRKKTPRREVEKRLTKYFRSLNTDYGIDALNVFSELYEDAYHRGKRDEVINSLTAKVFEQQGIAFLSEDEEMTDDVEFASRGIYWLKDRLITDFERA